MRGQFRKKKKNLRITKRHKTFINNPRLNPVQHQLILMDWASVFELLQHILLSILIGLINILGSREQLTVFQPSVWGLELSGAPLPDLQAD